MQEQEKGISSYLSLDIDHLECALPCSSKHFDGLASVETDSIGASLKELLARKIAKELCALLVARKCQFFGQELNLDIGFVSVVMSVLGH